MAAKLEDVAHRAGVSTASVSRVLADKPHVSPRVRDRVLAAVAELNFQPNRLARSLRAQRSQVLGVIISDIQNPFFTTIVRAIEDSAYQHRYTLVLCNTDEDPEKEALYIDLMIAEQVAGVVLSPTRTSDLSCQRLADANIPTVAIDRRPHNAAIDSVTVDNVGATVELITHLIDDGHQRIGAVLGVTTAMTGYERLEGYRQALHLRNLPFLPKLVYTGTPNSEVGYRFTHELLALPSPPTAIFTGNNLLTLGALQAIHERNLHIPDEVALVAFDEMDWMFVMKPALTVVAQPVKAMGQIAAELLLARLRGEETGPPRQIVLSPTVHIRQSCAYHTPGQE